MKVINFEYYSAFHYQIYEVIEKNGTAYIIAKIHFQDKKKVYERGGENYNNYSDIEVQIPVSKIKDISFITVEKTETNNPVQKISYGYRGMFLTSTGNNILYKDIEKGTTTPLPLFMLPSLNTEDESKLKNAISNLQSFYKKDVDPF